MCLLQPLKLIERVKANDLNSLRFVFDVVVSGKIAAIG